MIFKALAGPNEYLIDHLVEVREKSLEAISKVGLLDSYIIRPLQIAALLHDIGKSLKFYQNNPSLASKGAFPGHELLSAIISSVILQELKGLSTEEKSIILYAVISHHQAMHDIYHRLLGLSNIFSCFEDEGYLRDTFLAISQYLSLPSNKALTLYRKSLKLLLTISNIPKKRSLRRISAFMKQLEFPLNIINNADNITLLKARLCCALLMLADTYVAMKNRQGEPNSSYRQMILDFFNKR